MFARGRNGSRGEGGDDIGEPVVLVRLADRRVERAVDGDRTDQPSPSRIGTPGGD